MASLYKDAGICALAPKWHYCWGSPPGRLKNRFKKIAHLPELHCGRVRQRRPVRVAPDHAQVAVPGALQRVHLPPLLIKDVARHLRGPNIHCDICLQRLCRLDADFNLIIQINCKAVMSTLFHIPADGWAISVATLQGHNQGLLVASTCESCSASSACYRCRSPRKWSKVQDTVRTSYRPEPNQPQGVK